MTTHEYVRRLRVSGSGAQERDTSLADPGEITRPMVAHHAFAGLVEETRGAAAHRRGVELPPSLETPRCLISPLV